MAFRYHVQMERGARYPKAVIIACGGDEVTVSEPQAVVRLWTELGIHTSSTWEHLCLQGAWFRHKARIEELRADLAKLQAARAERGLVIRGIRGRE